MLAQFSIREKPRLPFFPKSSPRFLFNLILTKAIRESNIHSHSEMGVRENCDWDRTRAGANLIWFHFHGFIEELIMLWKQKVNKLSRESCDVILCLLTTTAEAPRFCWDIVLLGDKYKSRKDELYRLHQKIDAIYLLLSLCAIRRSLNSSSFLL